MKRMSAIAAVTAIILLGQPDTARSQFVIDTLAAGPAIAFPVAIAFPPDASHRLFFTEKNTGQVRVIRNDTLLGPAFLTVSVTGSGEQGLLGIAFHPHYPDSPYVYVYYTRSGDRANMLVRYRDQNGSGTSPETLMVIPRLTAATNHNGGNVHFGPDEKLYVTIGDNAVSSNSQDTSNGNKRGKIHRLNDDGTIPADNPFPGNSLYVYGCRNSFDFTFDAATGRCYASENGPNCDDEINRILAGRNYGWPIEGNCTYSGDPQYEAPLYYWPTVLPAVTGIQIYRGTAFPSLAGMMLVASSNDGAVYQFSLNSAGDSITSGPATLIDFSSGLNDIETGPDGALYIANGTYGGTSRIFRLRPVVTIPAAPEQVSPADGAVQQPRRPTLVWHPAAGATMYHLQAAGDSQWTGLVFNDSTLADTTKMLAPLAYDTKYFWRVRAWNTAGYGTYSAVRSFRTILATPAVPQQASPQDGATEQPPDPTLRWHPSPGAASYRLVIGTDSSLSPPVIDDSTLTDTLRQAAGLNTGTTYYWKVRASNAGGPSAYSPLWRFTTLFGPPGVPLLASPADGAGNQPLTLSLSWNAAANAGSYRLQAAKDSGFSDIVVHDSGIAATSRTVGPLGEHTRHFWRVRAENASGSGDWSASRSFVTMEEVTRSYFVRRKWNLVSLPLDVADRSLDSVFPFAATAAFGYRAGKGYVQHDTLDPGAGYWLKFTSDQKVSLTGFPAGSDTIGLTAGWNLIGALSDSVAASAVQAFPKGNLSSPFYGYDNAYIASPFLAPAMGYWVRAREAGYMIVPSPPAVENSVPRSRRFR